MFQINTDLSPVDHSKSPVSNCFISPKDMLALNLGSSRFHKQSKDGQTSGAADFVDSNSMRNVRPELDHPNINNPTTITTNESYSIEKCTHTESLNKDYLYVNSSSRITHRENTTERNLQADDENNKNQTETMHILEYEEFIPDEGVISSKRTLKQRDADFANHLDKNLHREIADNSNRRSLNSKESLINMNQQKYEASVLDHPKEALLDKRINLNHGVAQEDGILISNNVYNINNTITHAAQGLRNRNCNQIEYNSFAPPVSKGENDDKHERSNDDSPKPNQDYSDEYYCSSIFKAEEEKNALARENNILKQEINRMCISMKEGDIDNLKLKEELRIQRETVTHLQERYKQLKGSRRDSELNNVTAKHRLDEYIKSADELKGLQEAANEYKHIIHEKDAYIFQLQRQYSEAIKVNSNDFHISMLEKIKEYKEEMIRMTAQIAEQAVIIQAKDENINDLNSQIKGYIAAVSKKDREILILKSENSHLREERGRSQTRCLSPTPESGNLSPMLKTDILYSKIMDKSRTANSPNIAQEISEKKLPNSHSSSERKGLSRPYMNALASDKNLQKATQPPMSAHSEKTPDDQASKGNYWNTLKWNTLSQKTKDEKMKKDRNEVSSQKLKNKSIDLASKPRAETRKQSQNQNQNQNVEDLQKKLSYLKNKRNEFGRNKNSGIFSKDGSYESNRKSTESAAGFRTTLKNSDVLSSLKNIAYTKYSELRKDSTDSRSAQIKSNQKSIQLTHEFTMDDDIKTLGPPLTAKPQMYTNLDSYVPSHHRQHQTEGDYKLISRYSSFSNTLPGYTKVNEKVNSKGIKKSYDFGNYTKLSEIRSLTEANIKNGNSYFQDGINNLFRLLPQLSL